jgi:sRNA-binding carbon storage regulator CsrA
MIAISIPGQEEFYLRVRHGARSQLILDIVAPEHVKIMRTEIDDD